MQILQNTPISCRSCGQMTPGREQPVRKTDGSLVMECNWRCGRCGTYLKHGITRIVEPAKTK
jgi:RNase P subunit RPR2